VVEEKVGEDQEGKAFVSTFICVVVVCGLGGGGGSSSKGIALNKLGDK